MIARLAGFTGTHRLGHQPSRTGSRAAVLDVSRAEREFGFRASTSFEKGLQQTVDWYLEAPPDGRQARRSERYSA